MRLLLTRLSPSCPANDDGESPLAAVIENGHASLIEPLLAAGVSTDGLEDSILLAVSNGHVGVIKRLIVHGLIERRLLPDLLTLAREIGQEEIVELLEC